MSLFSFVKSVSLNHYYQCILSRPCVYIVNDNVTVIFIVSNMHCNFHYVTFMYSKGDNIKSVLRILKWKYIYINKWGIIFRVHIHMQLCLSDRFVMDEVVQLLNSRIFKRWIAHQAISNVMCYVYEQDTLTKYHCWVQVQWRNSNMSRMDDVI